MTKAQDEEKKYNGYVDLTIHVEGKSLMGFVKKITRMITDIESELDYVGEILETKITAEDKDGQDITVMVRRMIDELADEDDDDY